MLGNKASHALVESKFLDGTACSKLDRNKNLKKPDKRWLKVDLRSIKIFHRFSSSSPVAIRWKNVCYFLSWLLQKLVNKKHLFKAHFWLFFMGSLIDPESLVFQSWKSLTNKDSFYTAQRYFLNMIWISLPPYLNNFSRMYQRLHSVLKYFVCLFFSLNWQNNI